MQDKLEYLLFLSLSFLFRLVGLNAARKFAKVITAFFVYIIPKRKDVVIKNLKIAFPELNEEGIKKLAFKTYHNFAITLVEILYSPKISDQKLKEMVTFKNVSSVEKYNTSPKGLVIISAHFGNWELGAVAAGKFILNPLYVIVQPLRNSYVYSFMNRFRTKWDNQVIELGVSLRMAYKIIKEGKRLGIVGDQRGPEDGLRVNFFGRQTAIYNGPATLALKLDVPLIYAIAVREEDYSYTIYFEEISREGLPEDESERVRALSQRHVDFLEKMIRQHPDQWLWMHNVWKY